MSVYKDEYGRKTWYCKIRYTDWTGTVRQHKKRGFLKKSDALQYEREFLAKQKGGCDMSFGSLVELYMADCKSRLRQTTYEGKNNIISLKILPFFSKLQVSAISASDIRKWQNALLDDPAGYSQTYLKTINNQLSAIFNFAVKYYGLPKNPAAVAGSIGKKNATTMEFWTQEEFQRFSEAISDKPASFAMFNMLFWTGMRSGEMLALTLNDINFNAKTISITKTFARLNGQNIINPPKTPKSNREITVPDFLLEIIKDYADRLADYEPQDRLFDYTKYHLNKEMERGCSRSGVKKSVSTIFVIPMRRSSSSWDSLRS